MWVLPDLCNGVHTHAPEVQKPVHPSAVLRLASAKNVNTVCDRNWCRWFITNQHQTVRKRARAATNPQQPSVNPTPQKRGRPSLPTALSTQDGTGTGANKENVGEQQCEVENGDKDEVQEVEDPDETEESSNDLGDLDDSDVDPMDDEAPGGIQAGGNGKGKGRAAKWTVQDRTMLYTFILGVEANKEWEQLNKNRIHVFKKVMCQRL